VVCEPWKGKLDTYLDGELSSEEMRTFDAHVRSCPSCSADALTRVQMKRAIHVAGKRFSPSAEFRNRIQQRIAPKALRSFRFVWMWAMAAAVMVVVSTDRHTVKPWFQGKIPFAFDLPELQNTEFSLLGGRMTYLDQTPGAHLIYDVGKHHISVFVFQERSLPARLDKDPVSPKQLTFNMETWTQGGLRYFVIGDASAANIDSLAKLFKDNAS
jgi:anti-sigma factor RsiW